MAASKRTTRSAPTRGPARKGKPDRGDAKMERLRRRTAELMLAYVAEKRATPRLIALAQKLKRDVDEWRKETGGTGLRATATRYNDNTDPDDWSCESCDWIMVSLGRVCFYVGCDPDFNSCSYICIKLPPDPNYPVS